MKAFDNIRQASRPGRMFGLLGLIVALVAMFAAVPSAPASAKEINGKLNVYAHNATQAGLSGISGATVTVLDSTGNALIKGTTDAGGYFSSYVPQGTYKLTVAAQGFQPFGMQIKIAAGQSTTIQAALAPAPAASTDGKLNVYAYNGMQAGFGGISGATVTVRNSSGAAVVQGATDARGYFSSYVPQGTYKLTVTAPGFQTFSTRIEIAAGQSTTIQAALAPAPSPVPVPAIAPTPSTTTPTTALSTLVPR